MTPQTPSEGEGFPIDLEKNLDEIFKDFLEALLTTSGKIAAAKKIDLLNLNTTFVPNDKNNYLDYHK